MCSINLEKSLIQNCAPTLAGLKSASLFTYAGQGAAVQSDVKEANVILNSQGVYIEVLLDREQSVLLYVYRKNALKQELMADEARAILVEYGYEDASLCGCIEHLKERLKTSSCFPHEIGLFLGYPPEDVKGFIDNKGQNCEYCGIWKVYCNAQEKQKRFLQFKKCSEVYRKRFSRGWSLVQMVV